MASENDLQECSIKKANHIVVANIKSSLTYFHVLQEVRLRFVGFGAKEDEWVGVKDSSIRVRSLPFEHAKVGKLKFGDLVLCFQVICLVFVF